MVFYDIRNGLGVFQSHRRWIAGHFIAHMRGDANAIGYNPLATDYRAKDISILRDLPESKLPTTVESLGNAIIAYSSSQEGTRHATDVVGNILHSGAFIILLSVRSKVSISEWENFLGRTGPLIYPRRLNI